MFNVGWCYLKNLSPSFTSTPGTGFATLFACWEVSADYKNNFYLTLLTHFQSIEACLWLWSHAYSRRWSAQRRHEWCCARWGLLDQCASPESCWLFALTIVKQQWFYCRRGLKTSVCCQVKVKKINPSGCNRSANMVNKMLIFLCCKLCAAVLGKYMDKFICPWIDPKNTILMALIEPAHINP